MILVNHGGGGMDTFYEQLVSFFARKGYAAAAMTFRGYPPSEGRQEYGDGEIRDLKNLMDHLITDPAVDSGKLVILGNSRGGLYSLLLAAACERIQAAVAWSAPVEMFRHYELHPELLKMTIGGSPTDLPEEYRRRSVLYDAGNIQCPVLLIHGALDEVVPVWHARSMYDALKQNRRQARLVILERDEHGFNLEGLKAAVNHTLKFFHEYLQ